jgi:hypothetical protein
LTAAQARKVIAEMVAISSGETMSFYTVETWLNGWLANKAGGIANATMFALSTGDSCQPWQTRALHPTSGISSPVMMTQKSTPTTRTTNCKRCVARLRSYRGLNERWFKPKCFSVST